MTTGQTNERNGKEIREKKYKEIKVEWDKEKEERVRYQYSKEINRR
jgi:hypothetical protein